MKQIKFFIQPQVQQESELHALEDRVTTYLNSLKGITLGPRPHGHLDVSFTFEPNNNSSYSDAIVLVVSEGDDEDADPAQERSA